MICSYPLELDTTNKGASQDSYSKLELAAVTIIGCGRARLKHLWYECMFQVQSLASQAATGTRQCGVLGGRANMNEV